MSDAIARIVRSGVVEAEHHLSVALLRDGEVDRSWGPTTPFWSRSAAKPFQAAVAMELGAVLADETLAVACASHTGQAAHVDAVVQLADANEVTIDDLKAPPAWPLDREATRIAERAQPVYHQCSGNHVALMAATRARGGSIIDYRLPDSIPNQTVRERMSVWADAEPRVAVDRCGVPCYSLSASSLGLAAVAMAERHPDVIAALTRFPTLVGGSNGRIDTELAERTGLAMKGGAEGVMLTWLPKRGAIVVKCWDGSERGALAGTMAALRSLDYEVDWFAARLIGQQSAPDELVLELPALD